MPSINRTRVGRERDYQREYMREYRKCPVKKSEEQKRDRDRKRRMKIVPDKHFIKKVTMIKRKAAFINLILKTA